MQRALAHPEQAQRIAEILRAKLAEIKAYSAHLEADDIDNALIDREAAGGGADPRARGSTGRRWRERRPR